MTIPAIDCLDPGYADISLGSRLKSGVRHRDAADKFSVLLERSTRVLLYPYVARVTYSGTTALQVPEIAGAMAVTTRSGDYGQNRLSPAPKAVASVHQPWAPFPSAEPAKCDAKSLVANVGH